VTDQIDLPDEIPDDLPLPGKPVVIDKPDLDVASVPDDDTDDDPAV